MAFVLENISSMKSFENLLKIGSCIQFLYIFLFFENLFYSFTRRKEEWNLKICNLKTSALKNPTQRLLRKIQKKDLMSSPTAVYVCTNIFLLKICLTKILMKSVFVFFRSHWSQAHIPTSHALCTHARLCLPDLTP